MINLVKILSSKIESGKRILKFIRYGKDGVETSTEAMPFGFDSNPPSDLVAIYAPTSDNGKTVIIGYINRNQLAEIGGLRLYSTDDELTEKAYVYLRSNGDLELLGDADNMVRYSELESAFNTLKSDLNDFINSYNTHIHVTTATIGATPTPGVISPTVSQGTPSTADISGAKIDEIKTI